MCYKKNPFKKKTLFSLSDRVKQSKDITKKIKKIEIKSIDKKIKSTNTVDLIKYFNLRLEDNIIQTPQVWGGSFFLRKCLVSNNLMKEHYEITRNRYDLIDDDETKFIEKPLPGFIAHRHSQSVLSILAKKINCNFLSAYESEWALDMNRKRTFNHLNFFPIIAKRDKRKFFLFRFFDRQIKNYRRKINKIKSFFNF